MPGDTYLNPYYGVTLPGSLNANPHYSLESYPVLWSQQARVLDHADESANPQSIGPMIYGKLSADFPTLPVYPLGQLTPYTARAYIKDEFLVVGYLDVAVEVGVWQGNNHTKQPVKLTASLIPKTQVDNPDLLYLIKTVTAVAQRELNARWARA